DENNNTTVQPIQAVLDIDLQPVVPLPSGLKYTDVELTDGSLLHCSRFALKAQEVELTLAVSEQAARIPLSTVASILNDAQDAAIRQEWQEKHMGKKRNQDFLGIRHQGAINGLSGTISGNDQGRIVFEYERQGVRKKQELDPAKVQGMIFLNTLGPQAPSPVC